MEELSILLLSSGIIEFTGVFASSILAKSQTLSRDTMVLVMIIIGLNTFLFLYLLLAARTMMEKSRLRETAREHQRLLDVSKSKQDLYTRQRKRLHEYKNQFLTISSMLGNLLDNALEAAEQSITEKMIQVQVIQEDKQLVVSIKVCHETGRCVCESYRCDSRSVTDGIFLHNMVVFC